MTPNFPLRFAINELTFALDEIETHWDAMEGLLRAHLEEVKARPTDPRILNGDYTREELGVDGDASYIQHEINALVKNRDLIREKLRLLRVEVRHARFLMATSSRVISGEPVSQAIVNIVYGIRCTKGMRDKAEELGLIDVTGPYFPRASYEALGFTVGYHGFCDQPIWCGVRLDSFSDGNDELFSKIECKPTDEQREEVRAKIAALPEALREMAGEPDVWFIWGGS